MQEFGFSTRMAPPMPRVKPPKRPNIGDSSPKLFYTSTEIGQDHSVIKLAFTNTSIIEIYPGEFQRGDDFQMMQYLLSYKKVELRNCKYNYVYVQEGQEDLFKEMYLGIKREEPKIKRKYI
jgi:hypothetical protein